MFRKVDITYYCDKNSVTFNCSIESIGAWSFKSKCYSLKEFGNYAELYNKLLDDFEAEYDDELSQGFDCMVNQFWKERCYNEI